MLAKWLERVGVKLYAEEEAPRPFWERASWGAEGSGLNQIAEWITALGTQFSFQDGAKTEEFTSVFQECFEALRTEMDIGLLQLSFALNEFLESDFFAFWSSSIGIIAFLLIFLAMYFLASWIKSELAAPISFFKSKKGMCKRKEKKYEEKQFISSSTVSFNASLDSTTELKWNNMLLARAKTAEEFLRKQTSKTEGQMLDHYNSWYEDLKNASNRGSNKSLTSMHMLLCNSKECSHCKDAALFSDESVYLKQQYENMKSVNTKFCNMDSLQAKKITTVKVQDKEPCSSNKLRASAAAFPPLTKASFTTLSVTTAVTSSNSLKVSDRNIPLSPAKIWNNTPCIMGLQTVKYLLSSMPSVELFDAISVSAQSEGTNNTASMGTSSYYTKIVECIYTSCPTYTIAKAYITWNGKKNSDSTIVMA
ncbi:uncharacterized protein LOC106703201 [Latimeria chalumnae]|uniref:uncharacterized protein LOC106703201 n=1 Tax=Latimeria chalumnae TaxID=7897 RepID=UPI00313C4B77